MPKNHLLLLTLLVALLVLAACGGTAESQGAAATSDPWSYVPKHPIPPTTAASSKAPSRAART
jgi:ABC-type glycerol-3-phosphate transport system substrate-binding protein